MIATDIKALLMRMNDFCSIMLQNAIGFCVTRTHYEITIEHLLLKILEDHKSDCYQILEHFEIDVVKLNNLIVNVLEGHRSGNASKPSFSPLLLDLIQDAWIISSIDLAEKKIRSGSILMAFLSKSILYSTGQYTYLLNKIDRNLLLKNFTDFIKASKENDISNNEYETDAKSSITEKSSLNHSEQTTFIQQFCTDFTDLARNGKIDPVFGRDEELRLITEILGRRRKNNPICVGEPGVGKTSIVEGLALKIIKDDVPDLLKKTRILGLDMGALEAGASVKGEFEKRLRGVINEIKTSPQKTILFIDEAHMLIGAGGAVGGSDAANLLKPSLARGELRTIAATTWKEYKKYFEKDPALTRRFQLVKLEEPNVDNAILILRGIKKNYEAEHKVTIRDDAVEMAAILSDRYITDRFLPDKAIDLLDTSCSRVKLNLSAKPFILDAKERQIAALERTLEAIDRDQLSKIAIDKSKYTSLTKQKAQLIDETKILSKRWIDEQKAVQELLDIRTVLVNSSSDAGKMNLDLTIKLKDAEKKLAKVQNSEPLIKIEVDPDVVAQVVADWTGVPLGKMQRNESATLIDLEAKLLDSIKGQDHALKIIADSVRAAKAGLKNSQQPLSVFLFVGPSGTGKTQCSQALADLVFGNRKNMVTINMSEFQESHTASRLLGSPPGYVGYGDGGMLTEAVRQRPYSVVLLDEAEKAHLDVLNVFYQIFDKGVVNDGEGTEINFKNTLIILTCNLASDVIQEMTSENNEIPISNVLSAINPLLSAYFKPALLARMTVVPFYSLNNEAMLKIVEQKLTALKETLLANNKMQLTYSPKVIKTIVERCVEVETGARNIDFLLNGNILPKLSRTIISHISSNKTPNIVNIDVDENQDFTFKFSESGASKASQTKTLTKTSNKKQS